MLVLVAASLPMSAAAQAQYHVLEKGETLYSIARTYGVKPEAIAKANDIDDPSKLRIGKKLLIPGNAPEAQTHRVSKGETLYSIAKGYGLSLDALREANRLGPSSVIRIGDLLTIPGSSSRSASAAAAGAASGSAGSAAAGATAAANPQGGGANGSPAGDRSGPGKEPLPDAVKTSTKTANKALTWPCAGEILYLDGKAYGVVIKTRLGEAMKAVAAGTVSSAGPYRGYGNVVFVLARGYIYVYGGNDSISVRAGDQVSAGQELGKVGMDSKLGGPAGYFLVFKSGAAVDPASAPRD